MKLFSLDPNLIHSITREVGPDEVIIPYKNASGVLSQMISPKTFSIFNYGVKVEIQVVSANPEGIFFLKKYPDRCL